MVSAVSSGQPMSAAEGESYHLALARVSVATSLEEAKAIATEALLAWRAGPPREGAAHA